MGKFEHKVMIVWVLVFAWMLHNKKTVWRKWSLFVFSILFCIFSTTCWKNQRQPHYVMMFGLLLTSLWNIKESVLKIRVNLILQCFEVLSTCLWAMEKLMMASAFNNLTDFLLPYHICPFVFFSTNKPEDCTNFSQQQFIIVNQPFLPTFIPVTCWFDSWLIGIWKFLSHLEILASNSYLLHCFRYNNPSRPQIEL